MHKQSGKRLVGGGGGGGAVMMTAASIHSLQEQKRLI